MFVSRNALAQFVDLSKVTTAELTALYNNYGGLEVESVYPIIPQNNYLIGNVLTVEEHPDAASLHVCEVDVGSKKLKIVCGAPNIAAKQYVIVAPVGTLMPNGIKIEKRDIRGVASEGMICSLAEIGIDAKYLSSEDQEGIFVFATSEDITAGDNALAALGLNTEILDISLTPNRADCLNYRGLAYETAALTKQQVDPEVFNYKMPAGSFATKEYVKKLEVLSNKVKTYNIIAYKDVHIKPAPQWMQSFLIAHDIRPINNVVDITNFAMLLLGLPLHAFDAARLPEKQIIVRDARNEEQLMTLDDKVRVLSSDDLVISTGDASVALAGVMGGAHTEINAATTSIVLEAAIFDGSSIHKSAAKFDLRSEASQRMEKPLDPTLPKLALALTSQLMITYADAKVASDVLSFDKKAKTEVIAIEANYQALSQRIGIDISEQAIHDILDRLSFAYTSVDAKTIRITPPTWRTDIHIFEDIVEEVARLYGLQHLPNSLPIDATRPVFRSPASLFYDSVHQTLQALGLQETLTYTLQSTKEATLGQYRTKLEPVKILHPLNNDRETLRTTTYYSMLETLQYHYNHAFASAAFYEITDVYGKDESYPVLSFGGYGAIEHQPLYALDTIIDFPLLKTWFERLLQAINVRAIDYRKTSNTLFHPGIAADIYFEKQYLGTFGKIHPQVAKKWEMHPELYVGQLQIMAIYQLETAAKAQMPAYQPVSKLPSITRDLAVLVARELPAVELLQCIWHHAGAYCRDVKIFDVYTGGHIDADKKSVALSLTFNSSTQTLTNQFVSEIIATIVKALEKELHATLRK